MSKVKIISNPYSKLIRYQQWLNETSEWVDIDLSSNKSSKLLSQELTEKFFPFKVKQIVNQIMDDYQSDEEMMEIYFEGSDDEFKELENVVDDEEYEDKITAVRSDLYLENARDILPEVKKLFLQMSPLIYQSVSIEKIKEQLDRFSEASNDVVPVCVMGNYSSGKSTFINSLIGKEVLPNGSDPVTARIYKISRSRYEDRAYIAFEILGQKVVLHFTDRETFFDEESYSNELSDILRKEVISMGQESMYLRINRAITIINDYKSDEDDSGISDIIELEIPFVNGVLGQSKHPFVIFDTPGSNSASNARHLQVLTQAMENMTNGLPIFLATPDTLDSKDNENLYQILHSLSDRLDDRFTMIVVNKADKNDLNRKGSSAAEERQVLRQAVPRNLYAAGIFYVSAIMGLGSKNNGKFLDDFYDETYEDQERKYNDPTNKRYKTLYGYDIMPSQIKERVDEKSAEQTNLVYANSGLYAIELEIESFAGKYAAYNKCVQSQAYLTSVIAITDQEIAREHENSRIQREEVTDALEIEKAELVRDLEAEAEEEQKSYDDNYQEAMFEFIRGIEETFQEEYLREKEREFTEVEEEKYDFKGHEESVDKAFNAIGENFLKNVSFAAKNLNKESLKNIVTTLKDDVNDTFEERQSKSDARHAIDKTVADELLAYVTEKYKTRLTEINDTLEYESQKYWSENTECLRNILAGIVAGSDVLTEERRKELESIIITYQKISFDVSHADDIFKKVEFERYLKVGDRVIWASDHLDLRKLAGTYNNTLKDNVQALYKVLEESHRESGHMWIRCLLDEILNNIVSYSPELSKKAAKIQEITNKIEKLISNQQELKEYKEKLHSMMDWKLRASNSMEN